MSVYLIVMIAIPVIALIWAIKEAISPSKPSYGTREAFIPGSWVCQSCFGRNPGTVICEHCGRPYQE